MHASDAEGTKQENKSTTSAQGQYFYVIGQHDSSKMLLLKVLDYRVDKEYYEVTITNADKTESYKRTRVKYVPSPNFYKYNFDGTEAEYENLNSEEKGSGDYGSSQKYFLIDSVYVLEHSTKVTRIGTSLALGVISFPFKLRFGEESKDFSGSFNFGAGIGLRIGAKDFRKFRFSILSGYSIANVNLDASSVKRNADQLDSLNNFTAFSFSLGFMVEYEKVQAGLFLGWDRISALNDERFGWKYQAKPWISVGFGYSIFSTDKEITSRPPTNANIGRK